MTIQKTCRPPSRSPGRQLKTLAHRRVHLKRKPRLQQLMAPMGFMRSTTGTVDAGRGANIVDAAAVSTAAEVEADRAVSTGAVAAALREVTVVATVVAEVAAAAAAAVATPRSRRSSDEQQHAHQSITHEFLGVCPPAAISSRTQELG